MRLVLVIFLVGCHGASIPAVTIPLCGASPVVELGDAPAAPIVVPVEVTEPDGVLRYGVTIELGDATLDAMLDTGSSGLRVLRGAVPDSAYDCQTGTKIEYGYHSGLELGGVQAFAKIGIGGLVTPSMPVHFVDQVGCASDEPDCDAKGKTPEDYKLFGTGYEAVLGVGLRNGAEQIGSPFAQLPGAPAFIVEAPPKDGGPTGQLVFAPAPTDRARFSTFTLPALPSNDTLQNGVVAWDDRYGLPACLDDATDGDDFCVGAELDCGNPTTYIEWPEHEGATTVLAPGASVSVTVGPQATPLDSYAFTVGAMPTPSVDKVEVESTTGTGFMNLGTQIFLRDDVLYDPQYGTIGLAAH